MSKLKLNGLFIEEMRGAHGDAVVRRLHGRTFTSRLPTPSNLGPSAAQLDVRAKFKEANGYATRVLRDPAARGVYERGAKSKGTSPLAQAMGDWLRPPNIRPINLADYRGRVGDLLHVSATDDTEVVAVTIQIRSASNAIIEEGPATLLDQAWTYTGKTALPVGQPVTIAATAKDRPGHSAVTEASFTPHA